MKKGFITSKPGPEIILKTFRLLNSTEHEFYPPTIANNCWHFNIYEQDKFQAKLNWA